MPRPDKRKLWATNDNISDPFRPWDGTPTKVDPGSSVYAAGFRPSKSPPAQHVNYINNSLGQYVDYLDQIDVLNPEYYYPIWDLVGAPSSPFGPYEIRPTMTLIPIQPMCWDSRLGEYVLFSGDSVVDLYTSYDLKTWSVETVFSPAQSCTACCSDPNTGAILVFQNGTKVCIRKVDRTWQNYTLTNANTVNQARSHSSGVILIGGSITSAPNFVPQVWKAVTDGTALTLTALTLASVTSYHNDDIRFLATQNGKSIAMTAGAVAVWTNSNLAASWALAAAPPFTLPNNMAANADIGQFMVIEGSTGKVYTSVDGSSWTLQATTPYTIHQDTLVGRGNIWICAGTANSIEYLLVSDDNGVNWRRLPANCRREDIVSRIDVADGRFHTISQSSVSGSPNQIYCGWTKRTR